MKINVIDLEATCWNTHVDTPSEIIQIGISQLDTVKNTITPPYSVLVKPEESFKLSDFCTELTGLTNNQIFGEGSTLHQALLELDREFRVSEFPWASWGDYDRRMFATEFERKHIHPHKLYAQHLNVKLMFHVLTGKNVGMPNGLKHLGIELEGRHHDGGDDAYNIAKILKELTERR